MRTFKVGQANTITYDLTDRTSGDPLTAGTVNAYLVADEGVNAGKWFRGSDKTWQAAPAIAAECTHKDDGHWQAVIPTEAWISGVKYMSYAKETTNLHISVSAEVHEITKVLNPAFEATWQS